MYEKNDMLQILWWLWHMPWMSETELILVSPYNRSGVQTLLKHCLDRGWVGVLQYGTIRPVKARYFLLSSGIREVMQCYGLELQWQVTERGLLEILGYLRALEVAYEVTPELFQSAAVSLPCALPLDPSDDPVLLRLDGDTRLSGFQMIKAPKRGVRPLAIAEYTTREGHQLWLPVYWFGKNFARGRSPLSPGTFDRSVCAARSPWDPNFAAAPIGSVVIAADDFSAWRVGTEVFHNQRTATFLANGDLVSQLNPSLPFGHFRRTTQRTYALGHPGNIMEGIRRIEDAKNGVEKAEEPKAENRVYRRLSALKGVVNNHLLDIVEDSPSIPEQWAEKKSGRERGALKKNFESLTDAEVLEGFEGPGGLYIGTEGVTASHERDRIPPDNVHGDYHKYLDADSQFRSLQHWHDRTLVKVQGRLDDLGISHVQGRRLNVFYRTSRVETGANSTTLKPDLWVAVRTDKGNVLWQPLELERSVYSFSSREQKRRPFQAAELNNEPAPLLFVSDRDTHGNWSAGQRAHAMRLMFDDTPILTTTLSEFLTGAFFGAASVWRKGVEGTVVDINHFANLFEQQGTTKYLHRKFGHVDLDDIPW